MTNTTALPEGDPIDDTILSLAHVGGTPRLVKIVQHPAFRNHPQRTDTLRTTTVPRIPMELRVAPPGPALGLDLVPPMTLAASAPAATCCAAA